MLEQQEHNLCMRLKVFYQRVGCPLASGLRNMTSKSSSASSRWIAEVVVVIAHQFFSVDGDGGKAVDVETLVFGNKIVKEQMVQTASKRIVKSSEKQKPRACVLSSARYTEIESVIRATAYELLDKTSTSQVSEISPL